MDITINRGTHETGGSSVELRAGDSRIFIDSSMPFLRSSAGWEKVDGILISRPKLSNYGFLDNVDPDIPVFLSPEAKELISISDTFIAKKQRNINYSVFKHPRPFRAGAFTVTPYLADRSPFDPMSFLIEAEGKRVFYYGGLRGHGRKNLLLERIIKDPPTDIDCLIIGGAMAAGVEKVRVNEHDVQRKIEDILKEHNNITFLFAAAANIDRLNSAYKACLKAKSILVIDLYTAFILDKLRKVSKDIPEFNWKNIRIKFSKGHADTLADAGYRALLFVYNKRKIDIFDINRKKERILMLLTDHQTFPGTVKDIEKPAGTKIIYSMCHAYLTDKFKQFCDEKRLKIEKVYTTGHSPLADLVTFAKAIDPAVLIPLSTYNRKTYGDMFDNVKILEDNKILKLIS